MGSPMLDLRYVVDHLAEVKTALKVAGYPDKADPASINKPVVVGILFLRDPEPAGIASIRIRRDDRI